MCFRWRMRYHQTEEGNNDSRISVLAKIQDKCDYAHIDSLTSYEDIEQLENIIKFVYLYMKLSIRKLKIIMQKMNLFA